MITRRFDILGMSCSACSSHIEKIVEKLNGVGSVSVNLLTNSMTVVYDDLLLNADSIVSAVQHAGYVAVPRFEDSVYSPDGASFAVIRDRLGIRFFLSLLFCLPLAWLASAPFFHWPLPHDLGPSHALSSAITQLLLTLPILIVNGSYFRRGLRALARRSPDMDSLIAIGAGTAFVYGVFVVYEIMYANYVNDLYFVSAGMILTLVTLGKLLESKAKKKTTAAIRRLVSLRPETAIVLKDGAETRVRVEDIAVGDIVVIRQGQHIPVDGVVLEGKSTLDVSAITGESIPVMKAPGDRVWSATINLTGVFTFRADRVGTDTTLASIIALVEESSASKVPIANLADRISGIFVPAVIVISSLTAIGWLVSGEPLSAAISSAISVLVISCPCALGLAAPTAVMVGTGIGARNGILVKNASALEMADAVDTVIIDKTGTLTEGSPALPTSFPRRFSTITNCSCTRLRSRKCRSFRLLPRSCRKPKSRDFRFCLPTRSIFSQGRECRPQSRESPALPAARISSSKTGFPCPSSCLMQNSSLWMAKCRSVSAWPASRSASSPSPTS